MNLTKYTNSTDSIIGNSESPQYELGYLEGGAHLT